MAEHVVRSPVIGTVWKIEAAEGCELGADDSILILESMKMEVPVLAPAAGTLARLLVAEGEAVSEDQDLAVIESEAGA